MALEGALERMVQAQKENHQSFLRAFQMTDAHLWVLNRLCRDIISDSVLKLDNGVVNMEGYYELFNANQKLQAQQQIERAAQEKAEAAAAEVEATGEAKVFGGDAVNAGA